MEHPSNAGLTAPSWSVPSFFRTVVKMVYLRAFQIKGFETQGAFTLLIPEQKPVLLVPRYSVDLDIVIRHISV
jgi:hypothetical protein